MNATPRRDFQYIPTFPIQHHIIKLEQLQQKHTNQATWKNWKIIIESDQFTQCNSTWCHPDSLIETLICTLDLCTVDLCTHFICISGIQFILLYTINPCQSNSSHWSDQSRLIQFGTGTFISWWMAIFNRTISWWTFGNSSILIGWTWFCA